MMAVVRVANSMERIWRMLMILLMRIKQKVRHGHSVEAFCGNWMLWFKAELDAETRVFRAGQRLARWYMQGKQSIETPP